MARKWPGAPGADRQQTTLEKLIERAARKRELLDQIEAAYAAGDRPEVDRLRRKVDQLPR